MSVFISLYLSNVWILCLILLLLFSNNMFKTKVKKNLFENWIFCFNEKKHKNFMMTVFSKILFKHLSWYILMHILFWILHAYTILLSVFKHFIMVTCTDHVAVHDILNDWLAWAVTESDFFNTQLIKSQSLNICWFVYLLLKINIRWMTSNDISFSILLIHR